MEVRASILTKFIDLLYLLCLGYKQIEPKKVYAQLQKVDYEMWESLIPSVQYCVQDIKELSQECRVDLAQDLKNNFAELQRNQTYTTDELSIINTIRKWLLNDSESSWATIVNSAPKYSSFASSILFNDEFDTSVSETIVNLLDSVGLMYDSIMLSPKERLLLKTTHPDVYKDYTVLMKDFNKNVRNIQRSFINKHGGKCKYQDLYKYLESLDLEFVIPYGFTGLIDTAMSWYSEDGELLDSAPSVTTYPVIQMNPNVDEHNQWIAKCHSITGNKDRYIYTVAVQKANQQQKYAVVTYLLDKLPSIRNKWLRLIKAYNPNDKDCISAVVLEVLYQTAGRIGSEKYSTYGINTLEVRHVSLLPNGAIQFTYQGKDNIATKYVIKPNTAINKVLVGILKSFVAEKVDKTDKVFTTENGRYVNPKNTNALFKRLCGRQDVSVHKIRTYNGTKLFIDLIDNYKPTSQAEAVKMWRDVGTQVGKKLNHIRTAKDGSIKITPDTALANYVDPSIQIKFFSDAGFRVPKSLENYL